MKNKFKDFYLLMESAADDIESGIVEYYEDGKIKSKYEAIIKSICDAMEKSLGFKIGKTKTEHLGVKSFSVSNHWRIYGIKNSTPKTDIIIKDKKISVKMGNSQLMSGGKKETLAIFSSIVEKYNDKFTKHMNKKINDMIENVKETYIDRKRGEGIHEATVKDEVTRISHNLTSSMQEVFNNDDFKKLYIIEAMNGEEKFGNNSKAKADMMLAFSPDGQNVSLNNINDSSFVEKILNRINVRVSFKSDVVKSHGIIKGKDFRSVTRVDYKDIKKESFNVITDKELTLFNEGLWDDIKQVFKKIADFFKKIFDEILKAIDKGVNYFLDFMGWIPEIENVDKEIIFY